MRQHVRISRVYYSVKDCAWIPHHDRHSLIQSRVKIHMGMLPKGAPKRTSTGPSSDTVERATILIATVNVQAPKGQLFPLGIGTACCKLPQPRMARPYVLGRPLGLT